MKKVFISWSGMRSREVAEALHDWLPNVIQAVQPWMSESDIAKGTRWSSEIASQLEQTRVGLICLTLENVEAPWILFEAGALSKTLENTFVCPYLFGIEPVDLKGPLAQFQLTRAQKEDTRKLIHTINQALDDDEALFKERVDRAFDLWWPELEKSLKSISTLREKPGPTRSDRDILEEMLGFVRDLARTPATPLLPVATSWSYEPGASMATPITHESYGPGLYMPIPTAREPSQPMVYNWGIEPRWVPQQVPPVIPSPAQPSKEESTAPSDSDVQEVGVGAPAQPSKEESTASSQATRTKTTKSRRARKKRRATRPIPTKGTDSGSAG